MQPALWIKYLFGQAEAIRRVAGSRAAVWTGLALVLLTSIARNYDQTLIAEKPFLWFFGSLLFSFVSATWMYLVVYKTFARRSSSKAWDDRKPPEGSAWPSFLGLFWMTAPIAWLYAIPVERFLDSVSATHANLALLGIVSFWRVVLMARVLQVTTRAPFLMALSWVLFAASVEVLVLVFFGGSFAKSIARGMGGMRNSPEEDILMRTMNTAFGWAFLLAPLAFIVALAWRPKEWLQSLPCPVARRVSWISLLVIAVVWIGLAVAPQRELANNVAVERLLESGQTRAALDYLAARQPGDFAPARALPPKPFEREVFTQLPACFGVVQTNDPPWVRALLLSKLDAMIMHTGPRWSRRPIDPATPRGKRVQDTYVALNAYGPRGEGLHQLLEGLARFPEGKIWLATNSVFVEGIFLTLNMPVIRPSHLSKSESEQRADWLTLSNYLHLHFATNGMLRSAAAPLPAAPTP